MIKNKFNWISKDLIGFSLTSLFNDFSHEMTTSLLPALVDHIAGPSTGPIALGFITGFADAASTFMKLACGWLSNRITYFKPILIIGYAITPIFVSLIGTAQFIWQILLYQTIAWMGRGLREPIRDTWLANISSSAYFGRIFGIERAFDTIGAIAGPTLAFFTLQFFALPTNFYISFIPGFISILCISFLTSNYRHKTTVSKYDWKAQIQLLPHNFKYFLAIMFIFGISNFNKTFFIYRAQEAFGHNHSFVLATSWAILLYILLNCMRAIAEVGIGFLSDYINRRILLAVFGFALFSLVNIILLVASTNIFLWILIFICAGFSLGTVTSLEKSYAAQLLPEKDRGTGFGLLQCVDGIGDLLSSVVVGGLWTYISPEISFIYAAITSGIAALFFIIKIRD